MAGREAQRRFVACKARRGVDQRHGRLITVFRLPGDVGHGLVQQDGDARLLLHLRPFCQRDFLVGEDLGAQFADAFAVDEHQSLLDVTIRFAAGTDALFGHQF